MSEYRRATEPLNPEAVKAANAAVSEETGGRRITLGADDAALRKKWMDAYIAAGGDYKVVKPSAERARRALKAPCLEDEKKLITIRWDTADVWCSEDAQLSGTTQNYSAGDQVRVKSMKPEEQAFRHLGSPFSATVSTTPGRCSMYCPRKRRVISRAECGLRESAMEAKRKRR